MLHGDWFPATGPGVLVRGICQGPVKAVGVRISAPPLDLRKLPSEVHPSELGRRVKTLRQDQALVVQSRHPLQAAVDSLGDGWASWPLVDGPSAYYVLLYRARPLERFLDPIRNDYRRLPLLYHRAVREAREGSVEARSTAGQFRELLLANLEYKETRLYPLYREVVGDDRLPRELGYEIRGIREGLDRLPAMLEKTLAGATTKRELDRFEIDFFHLVEHHVEREKLSLLPALELLGGEALRRLLPDPRCSDKPPTKDGSGES